MSERTPEGTIEDKLRDVRKALDMEVAFFLDSNHL